MRRALKCSRRRFRRSSRRRSPSCVSSSQERLWRTKRLSATTTSPTEWPCILSSRLAEAAVAGIVAAPELRRSSSSSSNRDRRIRVRHHSAWAPLGGCLACLTSVWALQTSWRCSKGCRTRCWETQTCWDRSWIRRWPDHSCPTRRSCEASFSPTRRCNRSVFGQLTECCAKETF